MRASWRLKPSLGMYSACPGTAGILEHAAQGSLESRARRRKDSYAEDNARASRLSDNWILSIKLARKRKSRMESGSLPVDLLTGS